MNWHTYFFRMMTLTASKSKDPTTKVGCVIVGPDKEVRSLGFNGFPRGVDDTQRRRYFRPGKYLWTEHAERNAIYNAARVGVPLKDCSIYLRYWPCADCARAIIQSGITHVYVPQITYARECAKWLRRWRPSIEASLTMFQEAEIEFEIV